MIAHNAGFPGSWNFRVKGFPQWRNQKWPRAAIAAATSPKRACCTSALLRCNTIDNSAPLFCEESCPLAIAAASRRCQSTLTPFLVGHRKPSSWPSSAARCAFRLQMTDCSGDAIVQTRDFMPRAQIVSTLLAFGIPPLFGQNSSPTIRTSVRLVTVPTLVFSKEGKLIPGLDANNFRVFDNGRQVRITLDTFSVPVSVVVAVQTNTISGRVELFTRV